jgi:LAS superfamily LD-carboxypeptidase LdcB
MENISNLIGLNTGHLTYLDDQRFMINKASITDFKSLKNICNEAGFDLAINSSFRDYKTQLKIWNEKALGKRDLLDVNGEKLEYKDLSKEEVLFSIMRWSALPGMSRHHWGTDIDVYDLNTLPTPDYKVELTPQEVCPEGCFGRLHLFLDKLIDSNRSFNFFRPYSKDLGGVSPEKWHLSHLPESSKFLNSLSFTVFDDFLNSLKNDEIELLDLVKENRELIYERYITNISLPNW